MPGAFTEHFPPSPAAEGRREDTTVPLFLALYLLLLAFFIMLTSLSTVEAGRSKAVMSALTAQFATPRADEEGRKFSSDLGTVLSPAAFMDRVTGVYETAIPAAQVTREEGGRVMEVRFHVDSLFEHGTASLRPAQRRAIAEIASSLSVPPPGVRYEAEALFGAEPAATLPVGENLTMRRAGVVARAFVEQGAPPASVSSGIEAGDPLSLRMVFRVVDLPERETP